MILCKILQGLTAMLLNIQVCLRVPPCRLVKNYRRSESTTLLRHLGKS